MAQAAPRGLDTIGVQAVQEPGCQHPGVRIRKCTTCCTVHVVHARHDAWASVGADAIGDLPTWMATRVILILPLPRILLDTVSAPRKHPQCLVIVSPSRTCCPSLHIGPPLPCPDPWSPTIAHLNRSQHPPIQVSAAQWRPHGGGHAYRELGTANVNAHASHEQCALCQLCTINPATSIRPAGRW
jgi:hypothetical protein